VLDFFHYLILPNVPLVFLKELAISKTPEKGFQSRSKAVPKVVAK
jgi:hypothetical protein